MLFELIQCIKAIACANSILTNTILNSILVANSEFVSLKGIKQFPCHNFVKDFSLESPQSHHENTVPQDHITLCPVVS